MSRYFPTKVSFLLKTATSIIHKLFCVNKFVAFMTKDSFVIAEVKVLEK